MTKMLPDKALRIQRTPKRCLKCGHGCPVGCVNREIVSKVSPMRFKVMLELGLTCEEAYYA